MNVLMPSSLDEATAMLAEIGGDCVPIAGGTDLLVHWPENLAARERTYLDLSALAELRSHNWEDDWLVLGALTTFWDIVRDARAGSELPILVAAARTVGAVQIQSRGTWAGNIANAHTVRGVDQAYQRRVPIFSVGLSAQHPERPGVHVSEIVADPRPGDLVYDPGHPFAIPSGPNRGMVRMPNVNEIEEMVNVINAARAY